MLNVSVLMGRLVADPELRHTSTGVAVTSFTLAIDRDFTAKGQEKQTDFIDIVAWRGTAEFVAKYFTKGQLVAIQGSIQTRSYTDKNGVKRKAFEIVASNVHFADSKKNDGSTNSNHIENSQGTNYQTDNSEDFEEIPDGELPF